MSIASTQASMRYVEHTDSADTCTVCAHSMQQQWRLRAGLQCAEGGFYVTPQGTCKKFLKADPPPKVQIGPTDI